MKERLLEILQKERVNEIIPFLKSLEPSERKKLVPIIKERIKYYSENKPNDKFGSNRGTMEQFVILSIAAFVCFNGNDYRRNRIQLSYLSSGFIKFHEYTQQELMRQIKIDDVLEWYHPDWMSEFINDRRTNDNLKDFGYDDLIRWHHLGYIELSPELIANAIEAFPYERIPKQRRWLFNPENLDKYPETLAEHIWLLFEYPTDINYHLYWNPDHKNDNWNKIFLQLAKDKKIDRLKLLQETLRTGNKGFNKVQTSWFVELFNNLNPLPEELLTLQNELFQCLVSPQSKSVLNALSHIKAICDHKEFGVNDFMGYIPVLLNSGVKSVITGTIDISDKIVKTKPNQVQEILIALSGGFIHTDESIQKKLAKLMAKYGKALDLKPFISAYNSQILSSVKPILNDFLEVGEEQEETQVYDIPTAETQLIQPIISPEKEIPIIDNFEDFLFFTSQAFDNNEPWHSFMIPVYLQKFNVEITPDTIPQLEPIFKKAFKTIDQWSAKIGLTDRLFASFFMSYGKYLCEKYPETSESFKKVIPENVLDMVNFRNRIPNMELYPFFNILQKVLDSIKKDKSLVILSTPTHTPLWIDPIVLIKRLQTYQNENKTPYNLDIQLAVSRCALDNVKEALQLAKETLTGELLDLIIYLFTSGKEAPENVKHPAWWMCASIHKHPHTVPAFKKEWGFESIQDVYLTGNFSWIVDENAYGIKTFRLKLPTYNVKEQPVGTFLPEYFYSMFRSRFLWSGDVVRLIASIPYNYDSIVAHFIRTMNDYNSMDSGEKASFIHGLATLLDLKLPLPEIGYLILAMSFFATDKTIKDYGASLWADQVNYGMIDNQKLGKTIAELLHTSWLPLKRFIDLIEIGMLNISTLHNAALEELLATFLHQIGQKKITNLKKLQQIYNELLSAKQ